MELLEIEKKTESELCLKEQELELEAWNDEVDPAVSTVIPNVLESCEPTFLKVVQSQCALMFAKLLLQYHQKMGY